MDTQEPVQLQCISLKKIKFRYFGNNEALGKTTTNTVDEQ